MPQTQIALHGELETGVPTLQNGQFAYVNATNELLIGTSLHGNASINPYNVYNYPCGLTDDGGFYVYLKNNTGSATVKGTMVQISKTVTDSVEIADSSSNIRQVGFIVDDGVANGSLARILINGIGYVLIEDSTDCSIGQQLNASQSVPGRALPLVDNVTNIRNVGYALESAIAGTNVLVKALVNIR